MKNNIQGFQTYENAFKLASLSQQQTTFWMWYPHSRYLDLLLLGDGDLQPVKKTKKKTT